MHRKEENKVSHLKCMDLNTQYVSVVDTNRLEKHRDIPLLSALKEYSLQDIAAFDVPGHKRGQGVKVLNQYFGHELMRMDVNSLPLLDNVSNAKGVIKEAQELLADAYHADAAFFMTNGTTSAIHCMLMSVLGPNDKVLLPRNIHKSALNGLILCGATPVYLPTEMLGKEGIACNVKPSDVESMLNQDSNIKAVFLLNPTYYGFVTDLEQIIQICHQRDVLVLVDEAHGAHFPFHPDLPPSGVELGADVSCVSIHKTGGALTQASALLVNKARIDVKKVQQVINMLQSTSCSYLLMSSLDGARQNLVLNGHEQLSKTIYLSEYARYKINQIPGLHTIEPIGVYHQSYDVTKLGVNVQGLGLTGFEVYELMWKKYNIQLEMPDFNNVLAVISLGDQLKNINRLIEAFKDIASQHHKESNIEQTPFKLVSHPQVELSPRDAYFSEKELVPLEEAIGRLAGESILAYPPGIPIVAPGERITSEVIISLKQLKQSHAFLTDNVDKEMKQLLVIKENNLS